jgi:hypothetical protein
MRSGRRCDNFSPDDWLRFSMGTKTMQGTIPRYGLAPPRADDALGMLARLKGVDGAAAAWLRARREAGVEGDPAAALSPEELLRVAEALVRAGGPEQAVGASLAVRARSWLLLHREHARGGR